MRGLAAPQLALRVRSHIPALPQDHTPFIAMAKVPHKGANISLADWGRKELTLAENKWPGLMYLRRKYNPTKPPPGRQDHLLPPHDRPDRHAH